MNANKTGRYILLFSLGILLCTVPVISAILCYFPLWAERGGVAVVSGFTVLLLAVAFLPLYRTVKKILASAASYTVWLVAFLVFFALSKIADEMTVISFVGFIGNLLGALVFRLARKYKPDTEVENEERI